MSEKEKPEEEPKDYFIEHVERIKSLIFDDPTMRPVVQREFEEFDRIPENAQLKPSFKVTVGLDDIGVYPTFIEAYTELFKRIKAAVDEGTSYQMLETTNWIEHEVKGPGGPTVCVLDFYRARDLAYIIGLMENGHLAEPPKTVSEHLIEYAFVIGQTQNAEYILDLMARWEAAAREQLGRSEG